MPRGCSPPDGATRPRILTIAGEGGERRLTLPNLYAVPQPERPPVTLTRTPAGAVVRINNALGDSATIAAFDEALAALPDRLPLVIDLTDTPSGGNTVVARAIMGCFVDKPTFYQVHRSPAEEGETGIARACAELVMPRAGKRHRGPVTVRVGRWTGSMGEGLAIGPAQTGARVEGTAMAGLLGAIEDVALPASGLVVKFPTERLETVDYVPRERFVPQPER